MDLDGIDGLIHISELSWWHVNHPSEILSIGDVVPVKVLDIDRDRQRISLGLKQTQEDPWQRIIDTYRIGDELEGKVTKVVTFGAFVEIMDGVEGLVHISELAHHHVENPREIVEPGPGRAGEDPRDRLRAPAAVAVGEAGGGAACRTSSRPPPPAPPPRACAEEIGDVPDLGLSEDVFAGPQVSGADDLRAALSGRVRARRSRRRHGGPAAEPEAAEATPEAEAPEEATRPTEPR